MDLSSRCSTVKDFREVVFLQLGDWRKQMDHPQQQKQLSAREVPTIAKKEEKKLCVDLDRARRLIKNSLDSRSTSTNPGSHRESACQEEC